MSLIKRNKSEKVPSKEKNRKAKQAHGQVWVVINMITVFKMINLSVGISKKKDCSFN